MKWCIAKWHRKVVASMKGGYAESLFSHAQRTSLGMDVSVITGS